MSKLKYLEDVLEAAIAVEGYWTAKAAWGDPLADGARTTARTAVSAAHDACKAERNKPKESTDD